MGRVFCLMKNEFFYSLDRDDIFYQYFISKWYFLSVFYHSKQEKITWIILSTHIWAILPRPYKCVSAWDTDTIGRGGRNTQGEEAFLSFLCYLNWMLCEKRNIFDHIYNANPISLTPVAFYESSPHYSSLNLFKTQIKFAC